MENVILIVHLILALCLVGVVLLQRSEGGGLGMGSSGGGGVMSGRQAATALAKLTWIFAACFIATSVALTVFAARSAGGNSVVDAIQTLDDSTPNGAAAPVAPGADLLPPVTGDAAPATTAPAPVQRSD